MKVGKYTLSKEILLVTLVIIIGVVILLVRGFSGRQKTYYDFPKLSPIERDALTRLVYTKEGEQIELDKEMEQWKIVEIDREGSQEAVDKILESLVEMKFRSISSRNGEDSLPLFGLEEESRVSVTLYEGETKVRDFWLGSTRDGSYSDAYFMLPGEEIVYTVSGITPDSFLDVDSLRNREILSFNREDITSISLSLSKPLQEELALSKDTFTAIKRGEDWVIDEKITPMATQIGGLLPTLESLNAESFYSDSERLKPFTPSLTVELKNLAGESFPLKLFKENQQEGESEEPVIRGETTQSPDQFKLSQYIYTRFLDTLKVEEETPQS